MSQVEPSRSSEEKREKKEKKEKKEKRGSLHSSEGNVANHHQTRVASGSMDGKGAAAWSKVKGAGLSLSLSTPLSGRSNNERQEGSSPSEVRAPITRSMVIPDLTTTHVVAPPGRPSIIVSPETPKTAIDIAKPETPETTSTSPQPQVKHNWRASMKPSKNLDLNLQKVYARNESISFTERQRTDTAIQTAHPSSLKDERVGLVSREQASSSLSAVLQKFAEAKIDDERVYGGDPAIFPILAQFKAHFKGKGGLSERGGAVVISFHFPHTPEFGGVAKRVYRINKKLPVSQILVSLAKKVASPNLNINNYSLSTMKGYVLPNEESLDAYGVGSLFLTWELKLVEKDKRDQPPGTPLSSPHSDRMKVVSFIFPPDSTDFGADIRSKATRVDVYTPIERIIADLCRKYDVKDPSRWTLATNQGSTDDFQLDHKESLSFYGLGSRFHHWNLKIVPSTSPLPSKHLSARVAWTLVKESGLTLTDAVKIIAFLDNEITNMNNDIQEHKVTITDLKRKLEDSEHLIDDAKFHMKRILFDRDDWKERLEIAQQHNEGLSKHLEVLKQENEQRSEENERLVFEYNELRSELREKDISYSTLSDRVRDLDDEATKLSNQVEDLSQQLSSEKESKRKAVESINFNNLQLLRGLNEKLRLEKEEADQLTREREDKLAAAKKMNDENELLKSDLMKQLNFSKDSYKALDDQYKSLESRLSEIKEQQVQEESQLREKLKEAELKTAEHVQQIAELNLKNLELNQSVLNKFAGVEAQNETLQKMAADSQSQAQEFMEQIKALDDKNTHLLKDLEAKQNQLRDLKISTDQQKQQAQNEFTSAIQKTKTEYEDLERRLMIQISVLTTSKKDTEEEREQEKKKSHQLSENVQRVQQELEDMKASISVLQDQITESDAQKEASVKQSKQKDAQLDQIKKRNEELEKTISDLKVHVEKEANNSQQLTQKLTELRKQYQSSLDDTHSAKLETAASPRNPPPLGPNATSPRNPNVPISPTSPIRSPPPKAPPQRTPREENLMKELAKNKDPSVSKNAVFANPRSSINMDSLSMARMSLRVAPKPQEGVRRARAPNLNNLTDYLYHSLQSRFIKLQKEEEAEDLDEDAGVDFGE